MKRIYTVEVYLGVNLLCYVPFTNKNKAEKYKIGKEEEGYEAILVKWEHNKNGQKYDMLPTYKD